MRRRPKTNIAIPKTNIATLKTNIATAKTDIAIPKTDIAFAKTNIATLKTDIAIPKTDIATSKIGIATPKINITLPFHYIGLGDTEHKKMSFNSRMRNSAINFLYNISGHENLVECFPHFKWSNCLREIQKKSRISSGLFYW